MVIENLSARNYDYQLEKKAVNYILVISSESTEIVIANMFKYIGSVAAVALVPPELYKQKNIMEQLFTGFILVEPINLIEEEVGIAELNTFDTDIYLLTSGTTGIPKAICHKLSNLTKTLKVRESRYVWGQVYQIYRMAGIQVFLNSLVNGDCFVCEDNQVHFNQLLENFSKNGVDSISATPSFWRMALSLPSAKKLCLKQVSLGGEIADQAILTQLSKFFPSAKLTHIYASTETGVCFSVTDGKAGFPKKYLDSTENQLYRSKLSISDGGELVITLNKKSTLTGDFVEIIDNRVIFKGRKELAINIGGNKILCEEIESVIRSYQYTHEVLVSPQDNKFLGQVPTAKVVLNTEKYDAQTVKKEIRTLCLQKLPKYGVPVKIDIVPSLTISLSGKINR